MGNNPIKVLCVDDQGDAGALLERQLSPHFECEVVTSADAALAALERHGPFTVLVTDYAMPGMSGAELMREVTRRWPDVVGIMLTAVETLEVAVEALNEGHVYRFVRKPWAAAEIVTAVRDAAAYFDLVANERRLRDQLARANAELDEKVQDLDEANELLEYWVEFSPAVLYSFTYEGGELRPSYIGKNFLRLCGFERTTAVIEPGFWHQRIEPEDRARHAALVADLLDGERIHGVCEYAVRHRDGNRVCVVDSMRAVHDGDGHTIEIVGAWMDVTARA